MKSKAPSKQRTSLSAARERSFKHKADEIRDDLLTAQDELHRSKDCALVVIIAGIPTAGRSEAVNELLEWLDPKRVSVHALDLKSREERGRPELQPYWIRIPARGRIAIFFEGWYEKPISEALHKPKKARAHWRRAVERIRRFESMLTSDRVRIVKVHFGVDRATQQRRLEELAANELTAWRVSRHDIWLAKHHDRVKRVWQRWHALTDQPHVPWHRLDGGDTKHGAVELGQLMLSALKRENVSAPQTANESALPPEAPTLPQPDPQPIADDDYDRELPLLQRQLALATRKKKFRKHGLVLMFEGMDAAGKGGAIRRITHALDAREYRVVPVSAPTPEEQLYPYQWRFWRELPRRGEVVIFDRSWYGRVLVERVRGLTPAPDWQRAYDELRELELELHETGLLIRKFWLSVSEDEQLRRFDAREKDPLKRFKVDPEDWINREHFADYQAAAGEMIQRTHAPHAPWVVVPADDKKRARIDVLKTVVEGVRTLESNARGAA